jgi:flagellar protein FliO/FliZ
MTTRMPIVCAAAFMGMLVVSGWTSAVLLGQGPGEPSIYRSHSARVSSASEQPTASTPSGVVPATALVPRTQALPDASASQPIPMKNASVSTDSRAERPRSPWSSTLSMILSLVMVVSLFLIAAAILRKSQPKSFQKLPKEVVEVLGRTPMGPRQHLLVLRFGSKLILVNQQAGEVQSLAEITDATEAARLMGLCEANRSESISASFRDVLRQVSTTQARAATSRGG